MITLPLLAGCRFDGPPPDPCSVDHGPDTVVPEARSVETMLPTDAGDVHAQLRWPGFDAERGERWPVGVVLPGGWDHRSTPVEAGDVTVDVGFGIVAIHLDLPGGGASEGVNDRRGPLARAAVAATLRYAAGDLEDVAGCTLGRRIGAADTADVYLIGASNGGNLAAATLADPSLEFPPLSGLIAWETPAGAPFATVEFGTDPTVYASGSCALDATSTILCDIPTDRLRATDGEIPELCFDLGDDARCDETDILVVGVEDPVTGLRMLDPALAAAAADLGLPTAGFAPAGVARAWWAERDAAQAAPGMVAAWPELPVMLVASDTDHVLTYADHPHVFGLGEALQHAGAWWTALNPAAGWLETNASENAPNRPLTLADPSASLLTEDAETPLSSCLSAGLLELSDRRKLGAW